MSEVLVLPDVLQWGHDALRVSFFLSEGFSPRVLDVSGSGTPKMHLPEGLPLMDAVLVSAGHALASGRLVHTQVGESLRFVKYATHDDTYGTHLTIDADDMERGLRLRLELSSAWGVPAFTSRVHVQNISNETTVILQSVTSWAAYAGHGEATSSDASKWSLTRGYSDWLAEGRWTTEPLDALRMPDEASWLTGHNSRGAMSFASEGTWSTGKHVPVAVLASETDAFAWAWQIEHNGGWRFELGRDIADVYFAVGGPTDMDHQWTQVLAPGTLFTTVPVTVAVGTDVTGAIAALTQYRRAARRDTADNSNLPVVFNDYMNTLNGDPTTDKLEPLIDAAGDVGANIFCIDAGWYDDTSDWWDSVGLWEPSTTRFRSGLASVIGRIRDRGMVPGLWLEPEVVGVKSPVADRLPRHAFFSRHGERVVEQGRFHLDLRHPAAVRHLDAVIDRLVSEFGIGYFKLDYNINPGAGTDLATTSPGSGLLEHNRAHLAWIDGVYKRHPGLVLENCASGAMRMDFALLSRMNLQSTSDQQDFLRYPPIAASAPLAMLPEQAANWAYPQPDMTAEEAVFTLTTSLLGRFYLSGHLDKMSADQQDVVREAVGVAQSLRRTVSRGLPFWPLGLPEWSADWTALGTRLDDTNHVALWSRTSHADATDLHLPQLQGRDVTATTVFPSHLERWPTRWDPTTGILHVSKSTHEVGARLLRLTTQP